MGIGCGLVLFGFFLWVGGKSSLWGDLPGDIRVEKGSLTFYFPIVTCLLLSFLVSFILWVLSKFE